MAFKTVPENMKLNKQVTTLLSGSDYEQWVFSCRQENKSSNQLLRELIQEHNRKKMAGATYAVLEYSRQKG
jgi:hypothetical protein